MPPLIDGKEVWRDKITAMKAELGLIFTSSNRVTVRLNRDYNT